MNVMQPHWVDTETGKLGRQKLARAKLSEFFARLQQVRVVMEACGSARHWARVLGALGHQVELLPAHQVRPFVRSNKDDAADARAIWVPAQQSDIRRVRLRAWPSRRRWRCIAAGSTGCRRRFKFDPATPSSRRN
jgi:transposase